MLKNQESQATTINRQTACVHNTDIRDYVEMLQNCRISENTANFIAYIMALNDWYGKVSEALIGMYGDVHTEEIINNAFDKKFDEIESVLYGFVNSSIKENIVIATLNEI